MNIFLPVDLIVVATTNPTGGSTQHTVYGSHYLSEIPKILISETHLV